MTRETPAAAATFPDKIDWVSAGSAMASISVVGMCIGLGMPLLSITLEQRGYSATMIGLNTAFAGAAALATAPLVSPLAARTGVVPAMLIACAITFVSFALFPVFDSFFAWCLLRLSLHSALSILFILSEYWMSHATPQKSRGLMLGIYATTLSLGFAAGPLIFSWTGSGGYLPFAIACIIVAVAAVPLLLAHRRSPDFKSKEHVPFLPYIWKVPTATAAVLIFGAVETGGMALLPVYGTRVGYTEAQSALLMTMIGVGNVLFQIPIGMLSDKVKDRRLVLIAIAALGLTGMLLLPLVAYSWWWAAGLLFLWGGMIAGLYTVGLSHLGTKLTDRELASANAAFIFCYAFGMLIGPQMIGAGMDWVRPHGFAHVLGGFFAAYIALAVWRVAISHPRG
jgi:MFS family permease